MTMRPYLFIVVCLLLSAVAWGQTEADSDSGGTALPRVYRAISLGMSLDALKDALQKDELFRFRGDRDVSFLPVTEQSVVETTGYSFIKRALFQLWSGEVFVMTFTMNTALVDYYSIFSSFVKKYGEPNSLDPKQAIWESEDTRISIERPLTVKYIDMHVFNQIVNESKSLNSRVLQKQEDFLNEF